MGLHSVDRIWTEMFLIYIQMDNEEGSNQPRRRIPGPAGIVQDAMQRRAKGKMPETSALNTQEFLNRAATEPEYDDSFNHRAWQSALGLQYQFVDGYKTLAEVRELQGDNTFIRVPLTMGFITEVDMSDDMKSLKIQFKDQTGTLNAVIHHSASLDTKLVGKFVPGVVIVVNDCPVFKPGRHRGGNLYFNVIKKSLLVLVDVGGKVHVIK